MSRRQLFNDLGLHYGINLFNKLLSDGMSVSDAIKYEKKEASDGGKVYMIVNVGDNEEKGKKYIGKTIRSIDLRWRMHIKTAKAGKGNEGTLQDAIRKYGEEAFKIEEIYRAGVGEKLARLEELHILKHESLYPNGYNIHKSGSDTISTGHAIKIDGVTYKSYAEAAESEGIAAHTMSYRVKTGYYKRGRINGNAKGVTVNGVKYKTLKIASNKLGVPISTIQNRLDSGFYERGGVHKNSKSVTIDGVTYESQRVAADALGVSPATICNRIRQAVSDELTH